MKTLLKVIIKNILADFNLEINSKHLSQATNHHLSNSFIVNSIELVLTSYKTFAIIRLHYYLTPPYENK